MEQYEPISSICKLIFQNCLVSPKIIAVQCIDIWVKITMQKCSKTHCIM